jgi:histidyl-tRNA synthetase
MVIGLILQKYSLLPSALPIFPATVLVTVFDEACQPASLALAAELRQAGINVNCYPEAVKLGKQLKYADRVGMRLAVVLGSDEIEQNLVTIKDLRTGEQHTAPRGEATHAITRLLMNSDTQ